MNRQEFREKAKKQIDEIFTKIDDLEAKKDKANDDVKKRYEEQIQQLKSQKTELQLKFEALQQASEDKWEDAKETFSESAASFKEGFSKLATLAQ